MADKYWWEEDQQDKKQQNQRKGYWWDDSSVASTAAQNITNRVNTWLKNHNTYLSNFQKRNSGRKFNYEDSYVSDSADWLNTVSQQKSNFDAEADSIISYMSQYKDYLDLGTINRISDTLAEARKQQRAILDGATRDNEWWNSFGSEEMVKAHGSAEEAYKANQRYNGYSQKYNGYKYEDVQKAFATLEDGEEKDWLTYNQYDLYKNDSTYNSKAASGYKSYEAQKIAEQEAKREEEANKTWGDKVADFIIDNFGTGNTDNPMLDFIIDQQELYRNDTSYREPNDEWSAEQKNRFGYLWTESPAKAYQYAEQVNNQINDVKKQAQQQDVGNWAAQNFGTGTLGTLGAIATAPTGLADLMDDFIEYSARGTITQKGYITPFEFGQAAQSGVANKLNGVDENGVAQNVLSDNWGIFGGKGWGDIYSLGVSTANSMLSALTLGGTGTLVNFIGQGGASGVDDALSRGATAEQALLYGTAVGALEGLTEFIPAENLIKVGSSATLKNWMKQSLKQGVGEFFEEGASSFFGNLADDWIMKDKSNFNIMVKELMDKDPNMTKEEAADIAFKQMARDVAFDAVGGFASGAVSGGLTGGYRTMMDARKGNQKNIDAIKQHGDNTDALIQEGLQNDVKSDSYKLATKYQQQVQGKDGKGGKAMTGFQIRNLLAANQAEVTKADLEKIQNAAANRLARAGLRENIDKIAELATKYATGQEMTRAERSTLANNKYGAQVTSELLRGNHPDNLLSKWENNMSDESGAEYSTEWTGDIGTESDQFLRYNSKKLTRTILERMANMSADGPNAYKSLESRMESEEPAQVSDTGKAVIRATGEEIDLTSPTFKKITKDGVVLDANGKTVRSNEIDYDTGDQGIAINGISKIEHITPEAATALYAKLDMTKSVMKQLNGMDEAFTYGFYNYPEADLEAGNFAGNLTQDQKTDAYKLGQYVAKNTVTENKTAIKNMRTAADAIAEKAAKDGKEAPKSKKLTITYNHGGGVIEDIATAEKKLGKLEPVQQAGIEVVKILHQMGIGTDYELFTSYWSKDDKGNPVEVFLNDEGQEEAAYAGVHMAADGKIRINLNAYSGTKGLTLNALSHELTHFIKTWSLEKYEAMADFLVKSYGEKGVSMHKLVLKEYGEKGVTMHKLVLKEQARLKKIRNGAEVSYSEAYDEVVANAFNRMLEDGKVMDRIAEIRQFDKSLADKIIECIRNFINLFKKEYQQNRSLFKETEALMEMKEVFEQLQMMFAEALVEASDNFQASLITKEAGLDIAPVEASTQHSYQSLAEAAGFEAVQNEDGTRSFVRDGQAVREVTVKDIDNSPIGAFINFSLEMGDISDADAKRQKEMFAEICTMACKTNDFAMTMQFVGSAVFTGMKANADKQYGTTYDFPSICTKTQAVIDAMSAKMVSLGRGLNTDEIVQLYNDVFASGNPVPCPECYVFSRWIGIGGLLDNIKKYQDYYGDMAVEDVAAEYRKMKAEVSKFADEQGISFGKAKGALTAKLTKEYNKLNEKIEKAQNQGEKVKPADLKRLEELEPMMNTVKGMTWLENVYFADSSLKKVNPKFRVPNEVLFDLNNGEAFATQYKDAWAFRTTQGAGYGKAITPYAEARLGEGVLVTNNTTNAIKGRAQGTLDNFFLNQMGKLDKKSRDALKRARLKQKTQAFIGGQRFQSTSDARYENASDYLLAALEMQAMGGMVQCYTKVDGAVPAFSAWGFSINQSLMPLNGGLDADGNVQDTGVGGMKPSVAFENRNKHESAGTITIGVNDNHIRAMFKQWVRDFIIPYHASGGKADVVAAFRRIQEGKEAKGKAVRSTDYSRTQSDKVLSDEVLRWQGKTDAQIQRIHEIRNARIAILTGGNVNMTVVRSNRFLSALYDKLNGGEWDGVKLAKSKVESQIFPNEFWDQTVIYEESAKITKDYLEYCEDLGFLHRFSGMVPSNGKLVPVNGYNENGERVQLTDLAYKYDENGNKTAEVEEFFWKVLTDRRMYDNNGNYLPQKVVTLNDTTAETVTGFAKNNQGREYDKAKAEALAKKIVGGQYSSQQTDRYNEIAIDFANHMENIVKTKKGWYAKDVFKYVEEHPELGFIELIYAKDKDAKKLLEKFLNGVDDVNALDKLSWYMGEAYGDKDRTWRTWEGGATYPYRGAVRTFRNAIKKRTNAIMTENVGGTNLGIKNGEVTLEDVKGLYRKLNSNEEIGQFAEKVFATAEKLGVNIRFVNQTLSKQRVAGDNLGDMVEYKTSYFNDTAVTDQKKANTILHELIHACTVYVMDANKFMGDVSWSNKSDNYNRIANAAQRLNRIYHEIQYDSDFKNQYGIKNAKEMVAELANEEFVGLMKKKNLWDRIVDWICDLFGVRRGNSAYENARMCVDYILDNPEVSEYKEHSREIRRAANYHGMDVFGQTRYSSQQTDRDYLDAVNRGDTETAQKMVDEAAKKAGYNSPKLYHGTSAFGFTKIDTKKSNDRISFFATDSMQTAGTYSGTSNARSVGDAGKSSLGMYQLYANTDGMVEFDANGAESNHISLGQAEKDYNDVMYGKSWYSYATAKQLAKYAKQKGYAGVIIKNVVDSATPQSRKPESPSNVYIFFNPKTQVKSADPITYDDDGDVIPLSERFNQTNKDIRYSTQQTDNITDRDMLANAFETISKSSEEYKMIQDYKSNVERLNKLARELDEVNQKIRDIRFGKGKYDKEQLKLLDSKSTELAKEITKYDKRLLNMEASGPLRKVIEQERKKEAQKTKEHVKEIQQNKKDRAEQAEYRHKIRKTIRELDKLLKRGNKQRNVKEDMKGFVSKALELADYLFTDHVSNDDLIRNGITVRMTPKEAALVKETEDILSKLYDHAESLTDEEFTRLDTKRKANEDKLRDLLTAQRNERLNTPVYKLFNDLVTEYASLQNSNQDAVRAAYNSEVERLLRSFAGDEDGKADTDRKKALENMRVADMTTEELWKLYNAYTMVLTTVRDANKLHVKGKLVSIDNVVADITRDFSKRKIPDKKVAIIARNIANKLGWDYEKLYYALDRIGSEAFTELVMNIANSENIVMQDIMEAAAFRDEIVKKYGFNNWDVNKEIDREFLDTTGKKFKLTLGELMSLYAYSRREGAWDHIEYGGFVFGEAALTNPRPADSYKLTEEQCEAITNTLTKEQKGYVEDMQKFLSETMGEKGNEVSMLLYGIKMFGEKNYFPIHIAGQFKAQANESQAKAAAGFSSMSNAGFTHAQNPKAKAPFVLEGFNDIWADHVNEMSRYHGTVPALEDMRRVMNRSSYSESTAESMAIKQLMENSFGKEAVDYFDNLYREANSGAITDKLQKDSKWLLSKFRKNSVAYSLSVLVQQPASLVRAYAMIDKKYFGFKGFGTITSGVAKAVSDKWTKAHTNAYTEMLKYAPGVTMAKEIGGFDTATGGSIRSYLLDTNKSIKQKWQTENAVGKGKAVMDLVDNNAIANLPNVADKIAWIEIWNACKRETVAKHKDLATNSEEFMQAVGERFTEVIRATQVYDSIFAKSPMLKSKNLAVQYLVSFMNEPNVIANMAESAVRDATRGNWKSGVRTAAVLIHSVIFTNLLKSIVYAMRDDDEDETYIEKYLEAVTGNMMDDFIALNYIPLARDVWSLAQGYDVERADMAIVADAIDALNRVIKNGFTETEGMTEDELIEFDKKCTEANWKLVESLASFFGIPVKNIRREIEGVLDHAKIASANAGQTTAQSAWDKVHDAVIESIPFIQTKRDKQDKLYDAIVSGDKEYLSRLKSTYKDDTAYNNAVIKALREKDPRIHEAAQAGINGNSEERNRIYREIKAELGAEYANYIIQAINNESNDIRNDAKPDKVKGQYGVHDFVEAVSADDAETAKAVRDDIIQTYVDNGKTPEEAEKSFVSDVKDGIEEAYSYGELSKAVAENMLIEYADMDEEDAASRVNYWAFCEAHPQYELTESNVTDYQEFAEPAEIPLDVFVQYVNGTKGLASKYDEWGDVEVTKREQVLEVIDSLPLTWQQKDALYLAAGYSEDKIWDVPW